MQHLHKYHLSDRRLVQMYRCVPRNGPQVTIICDFNMFLAKYIYYTELNSPPQHKSRRSYKCGQKQDSCPQTFLNEMRIWIEEV